MITYSRLIRNIIIISVTVCLGLFLFQYFDLNQVLDIAMGLPESVIFLAILTFIITFLISCFRYSMVLSAIGVPVPLHAAAQANLLGIVGGLVLFQFLGQTLTRAAFLKRFGVNTGGILVANIYERALALFWLFVMMIGASWILFGKISIDFSSGGTSLVKLLILLVITFTINCLFVFRRILLIAIRNTSRKIIFSTLKVSISTIIIHLLMMSIYVALGHSVAPSVPIIDLAAASVIVMFAASIPISFAGWGVREISAIYAYGAIGLKAEQALSVSIIIGLMSLFLLIALTVIALIIPFSSKEEKQTKKHQIALAQSVNLQRFLGWTIPLLAGFLVFFQVYLPVGDGELSINLADPIAIAGGFIFLGLYWQFRNKENLWRIKRFESIILIATIAIIASFLLGAARFGIIDWALYNRSLGWFILLGYLGTGALLVATAGRGGVILLAQTMLVTGLILITFDFLIYQAISLGYPLKQFFSPSLLFTGMAQNSNTFAFQLLTLLALSLTVLKHYKPNAKTFELFALTMILVAIAYTQSRTAYVVTCSILIFVIALKWASWQKILIALSLTTTILFLPSIIDQISLLQNLQIKFLNQNLFQHASSDHERWYTITKGFQLWTEHPIFGAGLGAFVHTVQEERGMHLIIHNSAVWLLAEMGLVGFCIFVTIFSLIILTAWHQATTNDRGMQRARALLLLLLIFALFQLPHDVFYQRIFWLILGALMFSRRIRQIKNIA